MSPIRRARSADGFTLIEVMVVLVIVGTLAGALGLGLGALEGRDADRALARLRLVLEAGIERAEVRGQPLAFERLPDGYRFWIQGTDDRWRLLDEAPLFVETRLPAALAWGEGERAGRPLAAHDRLDLGAHPVPFVLALAGDGRRHRLRGLASGEVHLLAIEDGR